MPSRMPSGRTTSKFDIKAATETITQLEDIEGKIEQIANALDDPIRKDISNLKIGMDDQSNRIDRNTTALARVDDTMATMNSTLILFEHFIRSRFFRFLNFFGKWFIYGPDDRIYINNEQNRNLVKDMLSTPKKEGLRGHNSENEDILTILDLMDGTGRSFRLFRFKGTLDGAKDELKRRHILLQLGDHLETLGDGKSYIWASDMADICDLYEVGKLPYLDDYGNF